MQSDNVTLTAGNRVRYWRELKGVSQLELATRAKIDNSRLCRIEKGARSYSDEIERCVAGLGLTMPEFYGALGEAKPS